MMRAAVFHGRRDIRVQDVSAPRLQADTDVVLDVLACGVCGTDAAEWTTGPTFVPLHRPHPGSGHEGPTILGHEFAGVVRSVGTAVSSLVPGQLVVSGGGMWCGTCRPCLLGKSNLCVDRWVVGLNADGGLAEQVRVPAKILVPAPAGLDPVAAAMAQSVSVGVHAVERCGLGPGQRVLVSGVGGVGGFVVAAARLHDPVVLVAIDINESRLSAAQSLGATHLIDARSPDLQQAAMSITDGQGFDVVIEASGAPASLAMATALVAAGGTVLLLGLHHPPSTIDLHSLALREVSLLTSVAQINDVDVAAAAQLLATTPLAKIVLGSLVDLDDVVEGAIAPLAANTAPGKMIVRLPALA